MHWGSFEKCAEIANESSAVYRDRGVLPLTLTELRTCLFFEQRRWRHYGYDPGEEDMVYLAALMDGIRSKKKAGQID